MNEAREYLCPYCGRLVANHNKFSKTNHNRSCGGTVPVDSEDDIVDCLGDDVTMVGAADNGDIDDTDGVTAVLMVRQADVEHGGDEHAGFIHGLKDFEHLNQFMHIGRCECTDNDMQLMRFMFMAQCGYGVSRAFSVGMLEYAKQSGGRNVHLPDSWGRCVQNTTTLIEKLEGPRKTFTLDVVIPMDVRMLLADPSQTHIAFSFECPITEMIRVAMFSQTCKSWENVAFTYEENNGYLDDFCNGDRYKRIAADMSPGGAILGAVLATDGICLDKCMFDSQEVCL